MQMQGMEIWSSARTANSFFLIFDFLFIFKRFTFVPVNYACVHACAGVCPCVQVLEEVRGIGLHGAGVAGGCELPDMGLANSNLDHLEEQYVLFTADATLAPPIFNSYLCTNLCTIYGCVSTCQGYVGSQEAQKTASIPQNWSHKQL